MNELQEQARALNPNPSEELTKIMYCNFSNEIPEEFHRLFENMEEEEPIEQIDVIKVLDQLKSPGKRSPRKKGEISPKKKTSKKKKRDEDEDEDEEEPKKQKKNPYAFKQRNFRALIEQSDGKKRRYDFTACSIKDIQVAIRTYVDLKMDEIVQYFDDESATWGELSSYDFPEVSQLCKFRIIKRTSN